MCIIKSNLLCIHCEAISDITRATRSLQQHICFDHLKFTHPQSAGKVRKIEFTISNKRRYIYLKTAILKKVRKFYDSVVSFTIKYIKPSLADFLASDLVCCRGLDDGLIKLQQLAGITSNLKIVQELLHENFDIKSCPYSNASHNGFLNQFKSLAKFHNKNVINDLTIPLVVIFCSFENGLFLNYRYCTLFDSSHLD